MEFAKLRKAFRKSREPVSTFDLGSTKHRDEITRLLKDSKVPEVCVHFEILGSAPQILLLNDSTNLHDSSNLARDRPPQESSASPKREASSDTFLLQSSSQPPCDPKKIYAVGSYTKILINLAWAQVLKDDRFKRLDLSWQKSACDLFNELRTASGKSTIERLYGNPTIRQLLVHENGFAPLNRFLIAPDGQFIMSAEEFLIDGPLATEDRYKKEYPQRGWVEYSNGNHIFAGMILEEVTGWDLSEALHELVLQRLNLKSTILSDASWRRHREESSAAEVLVHGFQISSEGKLTRLESPRYLADTIEMAAFGAWSSLEDIATINRELLRGTERLPGCEFTYEEVKDFLTLGPGLGGGTASTLAGCFNSLDSNLLGIESPVRSLFRHQDHKSYRLGQRRHSPPVSAYHKVGYIDGFATTVHLVLNYRTFVIVISNATGPIDVADHVARYVLQEAFSLSPKQEIVDLAIKEGDICSKWLRILEMKDTLETEMNHDMASLAGKYRHNRFRQMITVHPDGFAQIHGNKKTSSHMRIVYCSPNTVRILPGSRGFGIDRWAEWDDLDFNVETVNGNRNLVSSRGQHRYEIIVQ